METATNSSFLIIDVNGQLVQYQTCQEFLDDNLTWADIEPAVVNQTNSCGFSLPNFTAISNHPVKYLTYATYPILLLICTCGNLLTIMVLSRNPKLLRNLKWTLLMALAVSDLILLWSQFFPYVSDVHNHITGPSAGFSAFTEAIAGVCIFLVEMCITSSDWFLVVFGIERFVAVISSAQYNRLSNLLSTKTRTAAVVIGIYFSAAMYALEKLFSYYWFFLNDDRRCPPQLIQYPHFLITWEGISAVAVVVIQLIDYILIVGLNMFVALRLIQSRHFGDECISDELRSAESQATKMLCATAIVYALTQCPPFVFNILQYVSQYPRCGFYMDDDVYAVFTTVNAFLLKLNYSINFLLYAFVSPHFRELVKELFISNHEPKQLRWFPGFKINKREGAIPLSEGGESVSDFHKWTNVESIETEAADPNSRFNGSLKTTKV